MNKYSKDELYHYGVLGMKWGKRTGAVGSKNKLPRKSKNLKNTDNAKTKKKLIGKRIAIGTAVTAGIIGGLYGAKKIAEISLTAKVGGDFLSFINDLSAEIPK